MAIVQVVPFADPNAQTRFATKTVTFTGASGLGATGTNTTWFTVAGGLIIIEYLIGRVTTNIAGATGTATLGVVGSTSLFLAATAQAALVTTAEIWSATTPVANGVAMPAALKGIVIDQNIISAIAGASGFTGGVIEMNCVWRPMTLGATLV